MSLGAIWQPWKGLPDICHLDLFQSTETLVTSLRQIQPPIRSIRPSGATFQANPSHSPPLAVRGLNRIVGGRGQNSQIFIFE